MKTFLSISILCISIALAGAQSTQMRITPTTTALARTLLQQETVQEWNQVLGVGAQSIIFSQTNDAPGVSNSVTPFYPSFQVIPPGTWVVSVGIQFSDTNTVVGFGNTNGSLTIGQISGGGTNIFSGQLTVTTANASYGFYVNQVAPNTSIPVVSSNDVAWFLKIK